MKTSSRPWDSLTMVTLAQSALDGFADQFYGVQFRGLPDKEKKAVLTAFKAEIQDRLVAIRDRAKVFGE